MLVTNTDTPWTCFKMPNSNLVYWVHSKCACSFYKRIFKGLHWEQITTSEVDWENDKVFSYIRNPVVKHRIGVIEWFYYNHCEDLLINNSNNEQFFIMLSNAAYLDWHSMSIVDHLGKDKSLKIQWIPIDVDSINHIQETISLIEQYTTLSDNTKSQLLGHEPYHTSTGFKKDCNQRMLNIPLSPLLIKSLEFDNFLYSQATIKNFEPATYPQRIEWLKQSGLSQAEAETLADADVSNGQYLNWEC